MLMTPYSKTARTIIGKSVGIDAFVNDLIQSQYDNIDMDGNISDLIQWQFYSINIWWKC